MKIYNTLTRTVERFEPLQPGKVSMYTCGPTVYDFAHIGNFRAYLWEDLLRRALAYVLREEAAMLFLYPRLTTRNVLEAAIISSLYLVPFAALPGFLVNRKKGRRLSAGGGMFNLVRRDAFEATGAFECLKDAVVDDVGLAVKVKAAGFSQRVALAGPLIRLRMYEGARATIDGFAKNTYPAMRKRPWTLLLKDYLREL